MNDRNGTALSVGQRVRFAHEHNARGADGVNVQTFIAYQGTVEGLYPARTPHPRGGGVTLTAGKRFPAVAASHIATRADFVAGAPIPPGVSGTDLVIVQLTGADRAQHMPDHDLETCTSNARANENPPCQCPVRGWWPAALVEVLP